MDPPARKEKSKVKEPAFRVEKAKQKSAQQELKQRQRAEVRLRRGSVCLSQLEKVLEEKKQQRKLYKGSLFVPRHWFLQRQRVHPGPKW